jgi:hypothetical protein
LGQSIQALASAAVKEARGLADLVVVTLHAHEQLGSKDIPAEFIPAFAREMIDSGADLVVGHGPQPRRPACPAHRDSSITGHELRSIGSQLRSRPTKRTSRGRTTCRSFNSRAMASKEANPAFRSFRIVEARALARASAACLYASLLLVFPLPNVIRPKRVSILTTVVKCHLPPWGGRYLPSVQLIRQ